MTPEETRNKTVENNKKAIANILDSKNGIFSPSISNLPDTNSIGDSGPQVVKPKPVASASNNSVPSTTGISQNPMLSGAKFEGERNRMTPNASTSPFSAVAPGGQGIFKDFNSGKTSIKLDGPDGAQFMSDRNPAGLNISGNTPTKATPQDVYSLMGRNPNMTQQFNDLTKPITPQEIEAYRLGKGNSPGSVTLAGGKDIFGDTQQLVGQHQTIMNQIDAHSRRNPVAPNDVKGMLANRLATKDLRDQAFDITERLKGRDALSANIAMNLANNTARTDVAGTNAGAKISAAETGAQAKMGAATTAADAKRDVEGMRGQTALTIANKHSALKERFDYAKTLNDQAELYRKAIKDLQDNDPGNPEIETMRKALKSTIAEASQHAASGRPNMAAGVSFAQ